MVIETNDKGVKEPGSDAETRNMMPKEQQVQSGMKAHQDLEGQQGSTDGGGHKSD
jgi:hypothetical protein